MWAAHLSGLLVRTSLLPSANCDFKSILRLSRTQLAFLSIYEEAELRVWIRCHACDSKSARIFFTPIAMYGFKPRVTLMDSIVFFVHCSLKKQNTNET